MALSTNIPRERMSEKRTTVFIVIPTAPRTINERNIDIGIEIPTKDEFRTPRKNNNTPTTRINLRLCYSQDYSPYLRHQYFDH